LEGRGGLQSRENGAKVWLLRFFVALGFVTLLFYFGFSAFVSSLQLTSCDTQYSVEMELLLDIHRGLLVSPNTNG